MSSTVRQGPRGLSRAVLMMQSDERLIELARGGCDAALEVALDRYREPLTGYCSRMIDAASAEDVVQETLARAMTTIQADHSPLQLKPWLYRVAHNRTLDTLKRHDNNNAPLDFERSDKTETPALVEQADELRALVKAAKKLPERQRIALMMREAEGRSFDEIAAVVGVSPSGVKQLTHRARTKLRDAMGALLPIPLLQWLLRRSETAQLQAGATAGAGVSIKVVSLLAAGAVVAGGLTVGASDELGGGSGSEANRASNEAVAPGGAGTQASLASNSSGRHASARVAAPTTYNNPDSTKPNDSRNDDDPNDPDKPKADPDKPGPNPTRPSGPLPAPSPPDGSGAPGGSTERGRTWRSLTSLSTASDYVGNPQIAATPSGNAAAIWQRRDGSLIGVEATYRDAGGQYVEPEMLSAPGGHAESAQVAVNARGDVVATWSRFDGTTFRIQSSYRAAGSSFGPAETLSAAGMDGYEPQVAIDPQGNATIAWIGSDPDTDAKQIEVAHRLAGDDFGAAQTVSNGSGPVSFPQIAVDERGDTVLLWTQRDGKLLLQASYKPAGGNFEAAQTISNSDDDAYAPAVAFDSNGEAIAMWIRKSGDEYQVVAAGRTRAATGFGSARAVSAIGPFSVSDGPQIATNAKGDLIAAWSRGYRVETAVRLSGVHFAPPEILSPADRTSAQVRVAINDTGEAVAAWTVFDSVAPQVSYVQAAYRPAKRNFQEPQTVSAPGRTAWQPRITADGGDSMTMALTTADGDENWRIDITQLSSQP